MTNLRSDSILYLAEATIATLIDIRKTIELVDQAFAADGRKLIETFPVISHGVPKERAGWVIKSGAICGSGTEAREILGLKAGAYWPNNGSRGLANHNATMMLVDTENGCVSTILGANHITDLRTAAAGAVASKRLAVAEPTALAIIGAGAQGHAQLEAHLCLFPDLKSIKVWNRSMAKAAAFVETWRARGISVIQSETCCDAVEDADIIVTSTAAREPIVFADFVKPGAHISAVGSDAAGKQELDPHLVQASKLFVDKRQQSLSIGEMQRPLALGLVDESHILAELGEVCVDLHPGRTSDDEITVFDSSGVSFQDLALAEYVRREAIQRGLGQYLTR